MAASTQPLFGWLDVDMMGQKAQGGTVVRGIVRNEVSDFVTDLVLPKYREQRVLNFLCIVTVRRLQREQNGLEFKIAV